MDHPHACGDKLKPYAKIAVPRGSSPRVWGQDAEGVSQLVALGIIPTRVGTSGDNVSILHFARDHPHACGDKIYNDGRKGFFKGSSPRVWGQGWVTQVTASENRIIPTRVGTSNV